MMGGSTGSTENEGIENYNYSEGLKKLYQEHTKTVEDRDKIYNRANRRGKIIIGSLLAVIGLNIGLLAYKIIDLLITPPLYLTASKIEEKDIDPTHEGLEQLLTIDGKQYTMQEKDGKPTLVKYEKKD